MIYFCQNMRYSHWKHFDSLFLLNLIFNTLFVFFLLFFFNWMFFFLLLKNFHLWKMTEETVAFSINDATTKRYCRALHWQSKFFIKSISNGFDLLFQAVGPCTFIDTCMTSLHHNQNPSLQRCAPQNTCCVCRSLSFFKQKGRHSNP